MATKKAAAGTRDARVDAYIAKAAPFAQDVLNELRAIVHEGAPRATETMKWSMPFFTLEAADGEATGKPVGKPAGKPVILGNMAAFKAHCSFGLWGSAITKTLHDDGVGVAENSGEHSMGSFGRIASMKDLPARAKLLRYVKTAAAAIESGSRTKSLDARKPVAQRVAKPALPVPAELTAALRKNAAAAKTFAAFSPSCQREYVEWIADAKREETKASRVEQAVAWMAEGKRRNWKYEKC